MHVQRTTMVPVLDVWSYETSEIAEQLFSDDGVPLEDVMARLNLLMAGIPGDCRRSAVWKIEIHEGSAQLKIVYFRDATPEEAERAQRLEEKRRANDLSWAEQNLVRAQERLAKLKGGA